MQKMYLMYLFQMSVLFIQVHYILNYNYYDDDDDDEWTNHKIRSPLAKLASHL